jgi:hypothetical protein
MEGQLTVMERQNTVLLEQLEVILEQNDLIKWQKRLLLTCCAGNCLVSDSNNQKTGEITFSALGRLEPFGKRRKEFGRAESPQRAEMSRDANESTWPQAG